MYKDALLNGKLNRVVGDLRHTDRLCVADCGLPVPPGVEVIDLALRLGQPAFLDVLQEIEDHLCVEKIILAEEIVEKNPALYAELLRRFAGASRELVPHERFKQLTAGCAAVVRTGENHPYANIILQSACIF